ncbi:MAG TPA: hypothetical protein VFT68_18905 [Lapillicoccus sp.]|nr:hypothetical protein [Lapillicoccus sp.]
MTGNSADTVGAAAKGFSVMAMDGLRGYIQLASGLAETSKAKATEAAAALLALTGGLSSARSGKDVQVQVQDLAEELLAAAAANRRSLIALVRSEVERAMARAPIPPDELDRARAAVAKLSADVEELRAQVMANPAVGEVAARLGLAGRTDTRPATDPFADAAAAEVGGIVVDTAFTDSAEPPTPAPPRRRPPRKQIAAQAATRPVPADADTAASQDAAEPRTATGATKKAAASTAATSSARKSTATKSTATKSAATKTAAKKATAKKGAAKKATAKKATATKSAATTSGASTPTAKKGAAKKGAAKKSASQATPARKATTGRKAAAKRASRSGGSGGSAT